MRKIYYSLIFPQKVPPTVLKCPPPQSVSHIPKPGMELKTEFYRVMVVEKLSSNMVRNKTNIGYSSTSKK